MTRAVVLLGALAAAACMLEDKTIGIDYATSIVYSPEEIFRPDPRPASERYVPIDTWEDAGTAGFHERWFGGQLQAMGEPILSRPGDRQDFLRRFRMLVLPSLHPAYAVRVDQAADGTGAIRIVRLDGAGGFQPGRIAQQEGFRLDPGRTAAFFGQVEASGLAGLPPTREPSCLDGAGFVFELLDGQGYRFVNLHQCDLTEATESLVVRADRLRRTVDSDLDFYRGGPGSNLRPDPAMTGR